MRKRRAIIRDLAAERARGQRRQKADPVVPAALVDDKSSPGHPGPDFSATDYLLAASKMCNMLVARGFTSAEAMKRVHEISNSPIFCDHANECPHVCPCPRICYCRVHGSCRNKKS